MLTRSGLAQASALAILLPTVLGALVLAHPAWAEVTGTTTYDVSGDTLDDVWDDIESKGFGEGDSVHAGQATSTVGSPDVPVQVDCSEAVMTACDGGRGWECTASMTPAWSVETAITLPRWPGATSACDKVKQEWNRFLAALTTHEQGHDDVVEAAIEDAKPASPISSGPKQDCDRATAAQAAIADLETKYNAELARLQKVADDANAAYDAETGHGATQGATLDTTVKCDDEEDSSPSGQLKSMIDELDLEPDDGLRTSLQSKLKRAIESLERDNARAATRQIDAFIKQVKAQRGKKLDEAAADGLMEQAEAVKEQIG